MFGWKKEVVVVEEVKKGVVSVAGAPQVPEKVLVAAPLEVEEVKEYLRVADSLGYTGGKVLELRLRTYLRESGTQIFPFDKVGDYLDGLFGKFTDGGLEFFCPTWAWRPLRQKDIGKCGGPRYGGSSRSQDVVNRKMFFPTDSCESRGIVIPLGALLIAEQVEKSAPGISFFVSDQPSEAEIRRELDPFMMASAPGVGKFVIARWDEPNFK
jgi:hypothetical protein